MSGFHDDTCANCGHPSESHNAGTGKCYRCPAVARCMLFVERDRLGNQTDMEPDSDPMHGIGQKDSPQS